MKIYFCCVCFCFAIKEVQRSRHENLIYARRLSLLHRLMFGSSGVTGAVVQAKHCALLESLFLLLDSTCWLLKVVIMWQL